MEENSEENKAIGIIPAFDTELSLANLRREIEEDFEISDFDFSQETGHQIKTHEEVVTKVVSVAQLAEDKVPIIRIIKRLSNHLNSVVKPIVQAILMKQCLSRLSLLASRRL